MFVNWIAFMTTLSRYIRLFTCLHVPSHMDKQLGRCLKKIVQLYARGRFIICVILVDMELGKIKDNMGLVDANTIAARERVAEIERGICLLKERS